MQTASNSHTMTKKLCRLEFEPIGRRGEADPDQTLLDSAHQLGVDIASICGGSGTCGRCKVQILSGRVSEVTKSEEKFAVGKNKIPPFRLACQAYPADDLKIHVPAESLTSKQRTLVEGLAVAFKPVPPVTTHTVRLDQADAGEINGDADHLLELLAGKFGLKAPTIDLKILSVLSPRLMARECSFEVAVRSNEVIALGPWPRHRLGLAVDLGTTKIAVYLVDLDSGETLVSRGCMNPQISMGEDVISRLTRAARSEKEAIRLQQLALGEINRVAHELCADLDLSPENILEAVIAGNTVMHHLLLNIPVERLGLAPYSPAIKQAVDIKARDLGLKTATGAYVHFLPNIAGFVGGDHVAMLLATGIHRPAGLILALDIGTNTEICLADGEKKTSVSCASGPAFEGAHIKFGMRAGEGAIEHLRLVGDEIEFQTVGGVPPIGLCGSGILDAMAQLYLGGVLDAGGKMGDHSRVRLNDDGMSEFELIDAAGRNGQPALTVTQKDIRELQLAKGAIRSGINLLLDHTGHASEEIDKIIIAGAFGSYIDVKSAVIVGMLPALPLDRFHQVGNAAGMGARLVLASQYHRKESQALAREINYFELAAAPQFAQVFSQSMYLGHEQ
jgi:uncharacterized 2Fe-2S/4Fe-4S cluster protein (DUF4445 family)